MSVAQELDRIIQAKADIITSLEAKGATVPQDALIDDLPDIIDDLPSGGGGDTEVLKDLIERDITSITIPAGTTKIGAAAFRLCQSLTSVTMPNSVTLIESDAFSNCSNLATVTMGNSVTTIDNNAFFNCSRLTTVTIPDSITSVDSSAFINCSSLPVENYVRYADKCAVGLTDTSQSTYVLRSDTKQIVNFLFNGRTAMTSITIPDSVIIIMPYAFRQCSNLATVTIGNSVTTIGNNAFQLCSSLTSITIPDSITTIGSYSFYSCSGLTSVTIGSGVTSMEYNAFSECTSLTSVTILATTPPTMTNYAFQNNASGRKFYVPAESVEAYKTASVWSTYAADIEAIPSV